MRQIGFLSAHFVLFSSSSSISVSISPSLLSRLWSRSPLEAELPPGVQPFSR